MPKFCFKDFAQKEKPKIILDPDKNILLDSKDFSEVNNSNGIKEVKYESKKYGSVTIKGLFDFVQNEIPDIIQIDNLKVAFSDKLNHSYRLKFDKPNITIILNLDEKNIDLIKQNKNKLAKIYSNFDTDYAKYIKFNISDFKNIDILEDINKEDEIENQIVPIFLKDNSNDKDDDILQQIDKYMKNDNEINEIDEMDIIDNPFTKLIMGKKEEDNIKKEEKKFKHQKNKYIKMKELNNFRYENNFNIVKLNKFIKEPIDNYKEISSNNHYSLLSINNNNFFTNNKNSNIEINYIPYNDELKDLKHNYQNIILYNFIKMFLEKKNDNKNMTINDYTYLLLSFIKNITSKIEEYKHNNKNYILESEKKYYINRLSDDIYSLKLFHILFLNCFISKIDEKKEILEQFDDYYSLKVQTMRKKLLIEWCVEKEKKNIKKEDKNSLIHQNKEMAKKKILSFGQIRKAIDIDNKSTLFNAKLSNLSKNILKNSFLYFKDMGNNHQNKISNTFIIDEPLQTKNDYISYLLQSLLYIENSNEYITKSIELIDSKIDDMNENSKPFINPKDESKKYIYKLNYLLLKIYQKLIEKSDEINNGLIDLIKMFPSNNSNQNNNEDHFIQYIILFLFSQTYPYITQNKNKNNQIFNKPLFTLLKQSIDEILIDKNKTNECENILTILQSLSSSSIGTKNKKKLFCNIITHSNLTSIETFWEQYTKEKITILNDELKEYISGIYYKSKCEWYKAYEHFLKAKEYKLSLDSYIHHILVLLSEEKMEKIEIEKILEKLNDLRYKDERIYVDFYKDFFSLIESLVEKKYDNVIEGFYQFLEYKNGEDKINFLNDKNHRMIVKIIWKIFNEKKMQEKELALIGNEEIMKLNNISIEEKINMFNGILQDTINYNQNNLNEQYESGDEEEIE